MTDTRLKVFCTVAEFLSFSKAASVLGISQPAVTKHIANIEKEIGAALFIRFGHNIILTEKGEELLGISREILKLYNSIDSIKAF